MMGWEAFSKTLSGSLLVKFFVKLNEQILVTDNAVLLLNTRKGYWIYKVFEREASEGNDSIQIYSDRYIKKIVDFSDLEGKVIYLVDDTLSHGFSLLETYEILAGTVGSEYIRPVVFAINEDLDIKKRESETKGIEREFWSKLKYFTVMSADEMAQFCIAETKLLHEENIPFVIDLPFLKDEKMNESSTHFEINITKNQFENLQERLGDKWKFHFNEHIENHETMLRGFIIQNCDDELLSQTSQFATDYVIEGTYTETSDGRIHMIFIPFAILNSMDKVFLDELWYEFFKDDYQSEKDTGNQIKNEEIRSMNSFIAKYRECVYILSILVAQEFIKCIEQLWGIRLIYDYEIMKEHFTKSFINTVKQIVNKAEDNTAYIYEKLKAVSKKVNKYAFNNHLDNSISKMQYKNNENTAYNIIQNELSDKRERFIHKGNRNARIRGNRDEVISIEEIKQLLLQNFEFQSEEELRYAVTKSIITMLNLSTCSNKLVENADRRCMIRGFRYGENSDLLIPYFNAYYYWAVFLYSEYGSAQDKTGEYEGFVNELRKFFRRKNYFKDLITEEDFNKNQHYFKNVLQDGNRIYNKFSFLKPYMENLESRRKMNEIENFVLSL